MTAENPHPGTFYEALADALDRLRRWPASAHYYEQAMQSMPQLVRPAGQLGMMLMRLGDEERAQKVLDEAFAADPFNVRVNNTLKVLEVLAGYETLETEHFRIKYDPKIDAVTARYMGDWLEEVYPQLVRQMGYEPPEKSLFEVFSAAKNTDGHGWFSARMVGLPHIHPIGACAGKIVALQSPTEGEQRFNWSRVLKHEFIHVINLQQTDFNIPHWFTEALAVLNEGYPRPQVWNDLLVQASSNDKLFHLDTINLGFIRPQSSAEWTLAYCQAELYAEYMLERFGPDAIAKMLAAYGDNLTTPEALQRAFGVAQPEFETGYRQFVERVVADLPAAGGNEQRSLAELQRALGNKPHDPALLAQMAYAQLGRRNYAAARRSADAALAAEPKQALAQYVRARLHLLVGENKEALERLEGCARPRTSAGKRAGAVGGLETQGRGFRRRGTTCTSWGAAPARQQQMDQVAGGRLPAIGRRQETDRSARKAGPGRCRRLHGAQEARAIGAGRRRYGGGRAVGPRRAAYRRARRRVAHLASRGAGGIRHAGRSGQRIRRGGRARSRSAEIAARAGPSLPEGRRAAESPGGARRTAGARARATRPPRSCWRPSK